MADYVERYSDAQAEAYARKIKRTYEQAAREVKKKLEDFQLKHKAKSAKMLKDVADGKITKADYQKWLKGQVFQSKQWEQKLKDITKVYVEADEKARALLGGTAKNVFAEAANHTAYDIEKDFRGGVAFNVYDRKTVDRLMRDNPKMLPEWKINEKKDYIWNEERVQNAVTQGIIQGERIADIGKRLTSELAASNASKMNMFARTAITGSQNAGRIERLHEAEEMGIKVKKRWLATLDGRTRDAHQELDGQVVDVDEPFHCSLGEIMFPGDPSADPANVYNCRCTMVYVYPDFKQSFERIASLGSDEDNRKKYEIIKDTTYKEWAKSKNTSSVKATQSFVVQGKDISNTWKRRPEQFAFEIEDVIDAQGFDGKPRVVDADEFDKLVKQANNGEGFIAQRTYSAPNQEILDAYREQLYNGKWYVDCSTGGAQYGQGMYCAADYSGKLTLGLQEEMSHYRDLNSKRGNAFAYTETFTLDRSAKIITYDEAVFRVKESAGIYQKAEEAIKNKKTNMFFTEKDKNEALDFIKKVRAMELTESDYVNIKSIEARLFVKETMEDLVQNYDIGVEIAKLGYDAINAKGHGASGSYTVILNRTKVIFRRDK